MIVTTRKNNEKLILVVDGIKIDIHIFKPQKINNDQAATDNLVSIGITAPQKVKIYREEVWERKQLSKENRGNR